MVSYRLIWANERHRRFTNLQGIEDSLIWADSGTYEYSTRFSIFEAKCLEHDLGSERVEERVTGARLSELFDELIFYSGDPIRTDATLINLVPRIESKQGIKWNLESLMKARTLACENTTIIY